MSRVWDDTREAHRRAVRDATLDTAAALVTAHGLASVTMSRIARETGIGRATLYHYFPDVDAVLTAWHQRLHALAAAGTLPSEAAVSRLVNLTWEGLRRRP